jgi:hypothetical protein
VQHVVAATTDQRVVAGAAAQVIGARTAGHEIAVASATPWLRRNAPSCPVSTR